MTSDSHELYGGRPLAVLLACFIWLAPTVGSAADEGDHWPSFRGPGSSGIAEGYATPTRWSVPNDENIIWKVEIPGLGHSSPVIWGDRIFVTTAVSDQESELKLGQYGTIESVEEVYGFSWRVYCIDKTRGEILWQRTVHQGIPRTQRHPKSSHANSTPATDGRYVAALFGSEGLYVFDVQGRLRWQKDLGLLDSGFFRVPAAQWGFGSSPVLHGDRLIVQADVQRGSFLAAFRLEDGLELWRTPRDELPTWSTPTIHDGRILVNGYKKIAAYELATGQPVWWLHGGGDIPVPTPVVDEERAFITNAHGSDGAPIYAIGLGSSGDLSIEVPPTKVYDELLVQPSPGIEWARPKDGGYIQTPIVYRGLLYIAHGNGILNAYRKSTGERVHRRRLAKAASFTASPVAADGKIYYTSESGDVYVIEAGPQLELLATNPLDDPALATPAISEGKLYFRTRRFLIAVGVEPAQGPI